MLSKRSHRTGLHSHCSSCCTGCTWSCSGTGSASCIAHHTCLGRTVPRLARTKMARIAEVQKKSSWRCFLVPDTFTHLTVVGAAVVIALARWVALAGEAVVGSVTTATRTRVQRVWQSRADTVGVAADIKDIESRSHGDGEVESVSYCWIPAEPQWGRREEPRTASSWQQQSATGWRCHCSTVAFYNEQMLTSSNTHLVSMARLLPAVGVPHLTRFFKSVCFAKMSKQKIINFRIFLWCDIFSPK